MSITSDIRSYADTAVTEGRKFVDSTLSTAQAQLNDVSGQAGDIVDKAGDAARELRASAEKVVNIDALKAAIEPYVEQARGYQASVQDRAEAIFAELKKDPRFAKAIEVADSTFDVVVETVQERVVKPVQSLTGLGTTKTGTSKTGTAKTGTAKTGTAKTGTTKTGTTKTGTTKSSTTTSSTTPGAAATPSPTKAARKPAATKPATPKPAAAKKTPARKAPVTRAPKA